MRRPHAYCAAVLGAALVWSAAAQGEGPAIVWVSQPVEPGEAVMIYGGPWTDVAAVELDGPDTATVTPLKVTDDCVTFVYPDAWPRAAFDVRIAAAAGTVATRVNAPDVWWVQGDAGPEAMPGGWLRVFGRGIAYGADASVELRSLADSSSIVLPVDQGDLYSLQATLPSDTQPGDYDVMLRNGIDPIPVSAGRIAVARSHNPWPDRVFDVTDYGAVPNDQADDSYAIRAALDALRQNGGGILSIPRGRFGMVGTLDLPPRTLLRGAGVTLSQIYWIDEDDPRGPLVSGTHDFGIEDLFLASGNIAVGIEVTSSGPGDDWENENILLRRVRTRLLHTDTMSKEEAARRLQTKGHQLMVRGARNVRILDCDFYCSKPGNSVLHLEDSVVSGNRFAAPSLGGGAYIGGRQVIFENNNCDGFGFSFGPGSRNYYFGGNRLGNIRGDGDRESFTFDGGRTTHNGPVAAVEMQGVTLPPGAWRDGQESWIGETVCVIGGKGAGQMRLIETIEGRDVELDRPWDIMPDTNSFIVVGLQREKLLMIDNEIGDGNPFQLYGSAANVVLARNRLQGNSMHAFGMTKGGSPEPSWFVQFLANEILEGNAVRGPWSYMVPAADGYIGFFDRGIRRPLTYPQNRVGIMRRNTLHSNAHLYAGPKVENMLVENNLVRNSDRGVVVRSKGAVVRGNRFEDVTMPYVVDDHVVLDPVERLAAALGAVEAALPGRQPTGWQDLKAEVGALREAKAPSEDTQAAVRGLLLKAVRAVSDELDGDPVPASTVDALLGIDLAQPSPWFFARIAGGSVREAKHPIAFAYPAWSPPARVSAEPGALGDWTVRAEVPDSLVPGESASVTLWVARPDDGAAVVTLPVVYSLSGDGWRLSFSTTYSYNRLPVTHFLAAGPFRNASGKGIDTEVHPPEIDLDVTRTYETMDGKRGWVPVGLDDRGRATLSSVFEHTELATAHAVAIVRSRRPLRAYVQYGPNTRTLAFVNGVRIGSSARRPGPALAELKAGENLIHLISSNASGAWPLDVTLEILDPVLPGDVEVVTVDNLAASPLLTPQGVSIAEGEGLPHSRGLDWTLVYSDDFDRLRLGDGWSCKSPGWMSQMAVIENRELKVEAGWGFLTWETEVKAPVRIECDVTFKGYMVGATLSPQGLAWRSFWGRGGGEGEGRGYCLALGWHNAKNNRVRRDGETVRLEETGWVPEEGETFHMIAQFVPPLCQIYVDGKLIMEYTDPDPLPGLDRIGLFSFSDSSFDDVRIYVAP